MKKDESSLKKKGSMPPKKPETSNSSPGIPLWGCLLLATFTFLLGLGTPVVMGRTRRDSTSSSSFSSSADGRQLSNEEMVVSAVSTGECSPEEDTCSATASFCGEDRLRDFWHDKAVVGFHILCFQVVQEGVMVTMYKDGLQSQKREHVVHLRWGELKDLLEVQLDLPVFRADYNFQPWAIFSSAGRRLLDGAMLEIAPSGLETLLRDNDLSLIYVGGQFLWPGVRVGFERAADLYSVMPLGSPEVRSKNQTVTIKTLALSPLVVSIEGFLTEEECLTIQSLAKPTMQYSDVVLMDKDAGRPASDFRTSQSTFLSSSRSALLRDIDDRVASLTRIPRVHQEYVQVLRYGETEKYEHHTDYFDPSLYRSDRGTLELIGHGRKNRLATVFWYLSDVEAGGHTAFPRAFGNEPRDMKDCSKGLLVKPELGKVIIFYSLKMNGEMDEKSLHGACPVEKGVKWAANKWIWNERMMYVR